jgi:hypothetical protein
VTTFLPSLWANARWEWVRLRRSRRAWLLLIPAVAGPVGSAVADVYLQIPSAPTAVVLGLLVTAGLSALVVIDLTALATGEDLGLRSQLFYFSLPQHRTALLAGRLLLVVAGALGTYAVGAALVFALGGSLIHPGLEARPPLFDPVHLAVAVAGLLVFLAGTAAAAAVVTKSASEATVASVLGGVVVAGAIGYLVSQGEISLWFPVGLTSVGIGELIWASLWFPRLIE